MNKIPKLRFPEFSGEWEEKELGEISFFLDGMRKPLKDSERQQRKGIFPYYGASGIIDYIDDYIFDQELILLGEDGANIITRSSRLAFLAKGKYWVNNHAHVIKAKEIINQYFLCEYLEKTNYEKYNTGTAQPKLNQEICKSIPIKYPSLPEQEEIASFLSSVDSKIEKLERKKELWEQYKKGMMQKIFSQELRFRDENGEDYPEWEEKELKNTIDVIIDNRGKTPPIDDKGIPLIEVNAIGCLNIKYDVIKKHVNMDTYENWFRKHLKNNDILFSTVGATGLCSLYTEKIKAVIAQNIIGLRFEKQNPIFMFYLLTFEENNNKLKKIEMGAVQPSIKVSQMIELSFSFPSLPEQTQIADFLSSIDSKIEIVEKELVGMKEFKKGLLQKMFV